MTDNRYLLVAVALSAALTWALRSVPFTVLAPLRTSKTVQYLSTRMPVGVMVILLVYCLRDVPLSFHGALAPAAALAATMGLHLWRRSALLSILAGTTGYVVLTSTGFVG